MILERTITQLDTGPIPADQARQMGQLGYMQWIAALPGSADYPKAAQHAYDTAAPFMEHSPAVAEFCAHLLNSLEEAADTFAACNAETGTPRRRAGPPVLSYASMI